MNALTMRMLGKNVFVVSICASCLVASPAPAQAPHPPGSSLSPLLRVKHQNMRIDRALASGRIDKKMAEDLRKSVNEVGERLKSDKPLVGDDLAAIQDKLNANSARIQAALGHGPRDSQKIMQTMKAEEKRELREERQRNLETMQKTQEDYKKEVEEMNSKARSKNAVGQDRDSEQDPADLAP